MADPVRRSMRASRGMLGNYRYLCKKAMLDRGRESAAAQKKKQQQKGLTERIRKGSSALPSQDSVHPLKRSHLSCSHQNRPTHLSSGVCAGRPKSAISVPKSPALITDQWEVDSGFSEVSPPASGRSSPSPGTRLTPVVALDCEMVGTGPRGCHGELARCSILDYHGNVLYDKYVKPRQPVTDFRTRWSGIRRHHLRDATAFEEAREEILKLLEGKIIVGHAVYNDFDALDMVHPAHMVRDTSSMSGLSSAGQLPRQRGCSLKTLASKLLNRKIQTGRKGHCSVEDARAALDLYKLVEEKWERELRDKLTQPDALTHTQATCNDRYMQDEYWPEDVVTNGH